MALNVKIEQIATAEDRIAEFSRTEAQMRQLYMQDGVIDDTEQAALDRIKGKIDQLRQLVARLRAEVEENKRIWESRGADWTLLQNQTQTMQSVGYPGLQAHDTTIASINQATTDQRWADASAELAQLEYNHGPLWTAYETQAAAKVEYDPMRIDLETRRSAVRVAEPQAETITQMLAQLDANVPALQPMELAWDYTGALETLRTLMTELEAAEAELRRVQELKASFDSDFAALQPRLTEASSTQYASLMELHQILLTARDQVDASVTACDYDSASAQLPALETAVTDVLTARQTLDGFRQQYEAERTRLAPRLAAASSSEMESTASLQQAIIDADDAMVALAEAENFEEAAAHGSIVEAALVAYEAVVEDRDLYETRLGALQDELTQASESRPGWLYLEPIQSELARIQGEMEAEAGAENFEAALEKITALEGKLVEFFAAIEAKRVEYEAAMELIKPRLEHMETCTYPVEPQIKAVEQAVAANQTLVSAEDWQGALDGVASIEAALDAGNVAHEAHDASLRATINADLPTLRASAIDPVNASLSSAVTLGNYVTQIDRALARTDHLTDIMETFNDAKALEAQLARLRDMRSRLASADEADDEALALYNELLTVPGGLANLPIEGRNMLIENLITDGGILDTVDVNEKAAVQHIWESAATLDPAFEAFDRETTNNIIHQLETDPEIKRISSEWAGMSVEDREAAMTYVGNLVGGENGWNLDGMEDVNFQANGGSCSNGKTRGWHRDGNMVMDETIAVCMNPVGAEWDPENDFADVIMNITHEVGHGYQDRLRERYEAGELSPGDPEYEQARSLVFDRRYFDEFPDDYSDNWDAYVHSPMEQQSRHTANRLREGIPAELGDGYTQELD